MPQHGEPWGLKNRWPPVAETAANGSHLACVTLIRGFAACSDYSFNDSGLLLFHWRATWKLAESLNE
jgi:hypothetical protein